MDYLHKALHTLYQALVKASPHTDKGKPVSNAVLQDSHSAFVAAHVAARQAGATPEKAYQAGYEAHNMAMAKHPHSERIGMAPAGRQLTHTFEFRGQQMGPTAASLQGEARLAHRQNVTAHEVYENGQYKGKNVVSDAQHVGILGGPAKKTYL